MKKATSRPAGRQGSSTASLRGEPEVRFDRFRVRRNPYAAKIARDGAVIRHDGPSARSLAAIPEIDFGTSARPSPYARRLTDELRKLRVGPGRPRAGEEVGVTSTRSIRLSAAVWDALEAEARRASTTLHAVLRSAVTSFLQQRLDAGARPARRPRRKR